MELAVKVCLAHWMGVVIIWLHNLAGGMMSVFLMGVYDKSCDQWRTVAKCGNGHDDATLERLQDEIDVIKISKVTNITIVTATSSSAGSQ